MVARRGTRWHFATTIFLSAFLLFASEPLVAKRILPWFGGSAAVWATCLVFYQVALFGGYLYAQAVARYLPDRSQAFVHIGLLLLSLFILPIGPGLGWRETNPAHPVLLILALLTCTVGLPFIALSATSPLLQHWSARGGDTVPYRLFSLSNLASLLALLSYPTLIEPSLGTSGQRLVWSGGYLLFVALCGSLAWTIRAHGKGLRQDEMAIEDSRAVSRQRIFLWLLLAACSSALLVAVTNHIAENVAAVPFLWVLPLALYLISFAVAFSERKLIGRSLLLRLLALSLGAIGYATYDIKSSDIIQVSLPIYALGMFVCCLFCHSELNRLRPPTRELTRFYVLLAAGSAIGAVAVGLIAPAVFRGVYELPLVLASVALLALVLTWTEGWTLRALWLTATVAMFLVFGKTIDGYRENSLALMRSFYGSLRVVQSPRAGPTQTRTLFHGTVEHGAQFLLPPRRERPTTYYGPTSGIGVLLRECYHGARQIAVVGLGAGTIAAYAGENDTFHFYEINSQVIDLAHNLFTYLRESRARTTIAEGDARLSLERDGQTTFDVLALDAFSGDAIPVHLLTTEAMQLYQRHLKEGGTIAFHISNQYLDLAPVVRKLADEVGAQAVLIRSHTDEDSLLLPADWVLVTRNQAVLQEQAIRTHAVPIEMPPKLSLWTDDSNNLLEVLKPFRLTGASD